MGTSICDIPRGNSCIAASRFPYWPQGGGQGWSCAHRSQQCYAIVKANGFSRTMEGKSIEGKEPRPHNRVWGFLQHRKLQLSRRGQWLKRTQNIIL